MTETPEAAQADPLSNALQNVTPWDVEGAVVDGVPQAVDYEKLIQQFGTRSLTPDLVERFQRAVGKPLHRWIRRGVFFSHRELEAILERHEKGQPYFLYTGRGPSKDRMHLGHLITFILCEWLQKALDVPIVIQLTDDEKYLFRSGHTLDDTFRYAMENAKDIIACGFDLEKTFIFSNQMYVGGEFYKNVVRISSTITASTAKATFGLKDSDSIGKFHFVSVQAAAAFSSSFPHLFGKRADIPALVPCGIDQDPYFRLTRDAAHKLRLPKPSLLHCKFMPALQGSHTKMSASVDASAIFMDDTPNQVKKKINKYAFSGGQATTEEHRKLGGNTEVDVAFQYLTYFLEDDDELETIAKDYQSGQLLTGHLKAKSITTLNAVLSDFQSRRKEITDDTVLEYMKRDRVFKFRGSDAFGTFIG